MEILVYLNIACLSIISLNQVAAKKCLQCVKMSHPFECNRIIDCYVDEMCFVEQYITFDGLVLYNSGCKHRQKCSAVKRDIRTFDRRQNALLSTQDVVACVECCHGDYCNTEGCHNLAPARDSRGPKCFACKSELNPGKCHNTVTCDSNQICALHRNPINLKEWTSKCAPKAQCETLARLQLHYAGGSLIGKRESVPVKICPRCCTGDFCNDNCGSDNETVTATSTISTSTTSTSTTSTSTTTKISTTKLLQTTSAILPTQTSSCQAQGYIYEQSTKLCLKPYTTPKLNWTDAQLFCKKNHGRLAIITSAIKKKDVDHFVSTRHEYNGIRFWVGATDVSNVHTFTWKDGKTIAVDDYERYDLAKANCLLIRNSHSSATYDPCPEINSFICENSNYLRP